jgi:hypothetical protein
MTAAACPAVFYADDTLCVAFWQNLAIVDTRGRVDVEHMLIIERAYQALARRFAAGIVSCVILQPGTPVSPPDALKESARFLRDLGSSVIGVAIIIEDVGIAAQVFRTVIRGINVLMRDNKLVVTDDLTSAIDVLSPVIVPATGEMDIASAVTAVLRAARLRYASMPPAPPSSSDEQRKSAPAMRS